MNMHILNSMLKHHEAEVKALAEKKLAESASVHKKFTALADKLKKTELSMRVQAEKDEEKKRAEVEK